MKLLDVSALPERKVICRSHAKLMNRPVHFGRAFHLAADAIGALIFLYPRRPTGAVSIKWSLSSATRYAVLSGLIVFHD